MATSFASHAMFPTTRPPTQSQKHEAAVAVSDSYHNTAPGTERQDSPPLVSHLIDSKAMDLASSAPIPAGIRDSGHINLYVPRPSTAPIAVPRSPGADLPPRRDLPFEIKEASSTMKPRYSRDLPAAKPNSAQPNPVIHRESQNKASTPNQNPPLDTETAQTAQRVDVPVGEAFNVLAVATQVRAEDIDTQQLLDKAAASRSKSTKKQNCESVVQVPLAGQSRTTRASQQRRRHLRCSHCRSKRVKCGFNEENPEGACQPCIDAGRPCSFAAQAKDIVKRKAPAPVKPEVQVQNSQEDAAEVSQPRRLTLRSRDVQPVSSATNLVYQEVPIGIVEEPKAASPKVQRKRLSRLAVPAPKRLKAQEINPRHKLPVADCHFKVKGQSQSKLNLQATKAPRAVRELSDTPIHLRSDATTATIDTLDLDPTEKPQKDARKSSPPRPLYSELSEMTDQAATEQENVPPQVEQESEPTTNNITNMAATRSSASDQDLSELTDLSPEARNTWLDQAFTEVLQDDSFIPFCNMISSRWEHHMFNFGV